MIAHNLPADTPTTPAVGSKGQKKSESIMLHIKLKEIECRAILSLNTPSTPGVGLKRSKKSE